MNFCGENNLLIINGWWTLVFSVSEACVCHDRCLCLRRWGLVFVGAGMYGVELTWRYVFSFAFLKPWKKDNKSTSHIQRCIIFAEDKLHLSIKCKRACFSAFGFVFCCIACKLQSVQRHLGGRGHQNNIGNRCECRSAYTKVWLWLNETKGKIYCIINAPNPSIGVISI